jgi:beta-ureidopropionase
MGRQVLSGLIQASNPINDESRSVAEIQAAMLEKHMPMIHDAGKKGVQILCLQEIFNGPYFCPGQDKRWYDAAEPVPGPTVEKLQPIAKQYKMVIVVPIYEREMAGVYYNTAAVIDADGSYLGKYRKTHLPQVKGFWEKFYFRPGNLGYPVFDTAVGRIGVYICYDRHFPEGWRALGLAGARIVFNPSATSRGLSQYLWQLEQPAAAVANEYFIGAINRVGTEPLGDDEFYGQSYFADPRGQLVDGTASDTEDDVLVRDLNMDQLREVRDLWAFYRDRRPDAYSSLVQP